MYSQTPSRRSREDRPLRLFLTISILIATMFLLGVWYDYVRPEVPAWVYYPTPTPTATPPASYNQAQAQAFYAEGKLDEAVQAYDEVIRKDPFNTAILSEQSRLLIFTGDTSKALLRSEQAMRLDPENPQNLLHYCRALDWEAKYEEAFDACFCALDMYPQEAATANALIAEVYTDIGNTRTAVSYAEDALAIDPNNFYGHFNMGYALEVGGDYYEAAKAYDQAIAVAPNIATSYIAAGLMYHTIGQYRKYQKLEPYELAIDRFKRAIRLRPFDGQAYTRLGRTYYFDGQYGRAVDALEQGLGVDPYYARGWGYLGEVYYSRRRFEDAIQIFPKAIDLSEKLFLRRARMVEIYAPAPTASGIAQVPIMQARLVQRAGQPQLYVGDFELLTYVPSTETDIELNCAKLIGNSLQARSLIVEPEKPITFTESFSQTHGSVKFNIETGELALNIENLPLQETPTYELKIHFWPSRVDNLGSFNANEDNSVEIKVQFDEKLPAPVQYYYQLGLSYTYLEPSQCAESEEWLLRALALEPAPWNPAWQGLKRCPSPKSPPTPIPTPTPFPTATKAP